MVDQESSSKKRKLESVVDPVSKPDDGSAASGSGDVVGPSDDSKQPQESTLSSSEVGLTPKEKRLKTSDANVDVGSGGEQEQQSQKIPGQTASTPLTGPAVQPEHPSSSKPDQKEADSAKPVEAGKGVESGSLRAKAQGGSGVAINPAGKKKEDEYEDIDEDSDEDREPNAEEKKSLKRIRRLIKDLKTEGLQLIIREGLYNWHGSHHDVRSDGKARTEIMKHMTWSIVHDKDDSYDTSEENIERIYRKFKGRIWDDNPQAVYEEYISD